MNHHEKEMNRLDKRIQAITKDEMKKTKKDRIDAIQAYYAKKGRRMTNLNKASAEQLDAIILQQGIDLLAELRRLKDIAEHNANDERVRQEEARVMRDERARQEQEEEAREKARWEA